MRSAARPLADHELQRLDAPGLFRHLLAMRDAGEAEAATRAMWFVLWQRQRWVRAKLAVKLPAEVVDDWVPEVFDRVVDSSFDGASEGELVNWLKVIIARAIADFHRGREGRRQRDDRAGAARIGDDDRPAEAGADDLGYELVGERQIVATVLAARSAAHREAIELAYFADQPARAVAERTGLTEANVYQLVKRFKDDCRAEAGSGEPG